MYSTETGLQFDETAETFENYEERLMQFLAANKIEQDRRRAVFLSVVGSKTFALLKDLISPQSFSDVSNNNKSIEGFLHAKEKRIG